MTTQTINDYFKPNKTFTINKRTNRGKRALALITQSEFDYSHEVGESNRYDNEGAVVFTLVSDLNDTVENYLRTVRPVDEYGHSNRQKPFSYLLNGVWNIANERWDIATWRTAVLDPETNEVVFTEQTDTWVRNEFNLSVSLFIADAHRKHEVAVQKAQARLERIEALKADQPLGVDSLRVERVQKFVDQFNYEVDTTSKWNDQRIREVRDFTVRLGVLHLAEKFLAVVGKTTLEVGSALGYGWRDDSTVHRVIGADEAFGIAVYEATRSLSVDSPLRDLFGRVVEEFISLAR